MKPKEFTKIKKITNSNSEENKLEETGYLEHTHNDVNLLTFIQLLHHFRYNH